ncbi:hypothetical protein GOP97_15075 [Vibrio cholerae]|uniref:hypothetical protein n=1 Tax=Vibrio cholerae TaxID=666 RepID=UPI002DBAD070|nr:hypothetical protein [Vibrio cholerae]MEB5557088.1 hypothetical protein [Vibrio cholerae]
MNKQGIIHLRPLMSTNTKISAVFRVTGVKNHILSWVIHRAPKDGYRLSVNLREGINVGTFKFVKLIPTMGQFATAIMIHIVDSMEARNAWIIAFAVVTIKITSKF